MPMKPPGATHMSDAGEYFKRGRFGLLFRWDSLMQEWYKSVERKRLRTISEQLAENSKADDQRTYQNRNY